MRTNSAVIDAPAHVISTPVHLAHCGTLFPAGSGEDRYESYALLRPIFRELWALYDQYLTEADYADVPWWYSERTIVGHLTAAAFRAGYCALEEFSCEKGPKDPTGRLDWLVGRNQWRETIQAETKQTWLSSNSDYDAVDHLLEEAAAQNAEYKLPWEFEKLYRLAMVFVRPYYPKAQRSYDDHRRAWIGEDAYLPTQADFCAYYWLAKPHIGAATGEKNCCPGLLICCKEVGAA